MGVGGGVLGIGVPAVVLGISGVSGGQLPVNVMTATSFLFPVCLGFGVWAERATPTSPS